MIQKTLALLMTGSLALNGQNTIGSIDRIDPAFNQWVMENTVIEVLASGFRWSEGAVWVPRFNGILFSDEPNNIVYKWTEKEGLSEFLNPSGMTGHAPHSSNSGGNGLRIDAEGNLILCQHGDRRIAKLKSWEFNTPEYETLVDHYDGKWLNSPNDLVLSKNGDVFFTDPPYGLAQQDNDPLKEIPFSVIYRWNPEEGIQLLSKSMTRPNGIALSLDEKTVYVGNSDPKNSVIIAYDLVDGKLINERVFFDANTLTKKGPGLFDGLKVHSSGTIFSTGPGGVLVIDPQGKHLGTIRPGKPTANCAFDADETYLYLTSNDILARIKIK